MEKILVLIDCALAATPQNVTRARRLLNEVAAQIGVADEDRAQIELALSEACTNAVMHGSPRGGASAFHVRCEVRERHLIVEVQDEGMGFEVVEPSLPEPSDFRDGGRGLYLMQHLVDAMEFDRRPNGMVVRLVKKLRRPCATRSSSPFPP